MKDYTEYLQKFRLKEDDILLITLPKDFGNSDKTREHVHRWIKNFEMLLPYKNKIVVIPDNVKLKVIEKNDQKLLGEDWWV